MNLQAYLDRIEYSGRREPTLQVLDALHLAHIAHIPFENLDVLAGTGIPLDLPSLQDKLVQQRRGGYCFEQNLLFLAALEALGFEVTPLAARVRFRAQRLNARTHMVLLVEADGVRVVADVGFGALGLMQTLPLVPNCTARHFAWTYRMVKEPDQWVLQSQRQEGWSDLYSFTLERQERVDYELANYWMATHPDSIFRQILTAQLSTPEVRYLLRNDTFMKNRGETTTSRTVSVDEIPTLLRDVFGIEPPASFGLLVNASPESQGCR